MKRISLSILPLLLFLHALTGLRTVSASVLASCPHGYITLSDHKKWNGWVSEHYWLDTGSISFSNRDLIDTAVTTWQGKTSKVPIGRIPYASEGTISVKGATLPLAELGRTYFYTSAVRGGDPYMNNWYGNDIELDFAKMSSYINANSMPLAQVKVTVMHEFGHCFGLDHSTAITNVMCQFAGGRIAVSPSTLEVQAVNHLY